MPISNKLPITIYEIERAQFDPLNIADTIGEIVRQLKVKENSLTEVKLNRAEFGKCLFNLYSYSNTYPPTWFKFLTPIIHKQDPLLRQLNHIVSFVGFVGINKRLFVFAGGYGSVEIERYTKPDLGLEIVIRIFEKDSRVLKSIQQRGVTGTVLGQSRLYRGDQRFSDENDFGQIFKQVQAELDKGLLIKEFGFSKKDLKREKAGCLAKSSFKINKAIDFNELLQVMKKIDGILAKPAKFTLNNVVQMKGKRFEKLVANLDLALVDTIYKDYKLKDIPDFEICHAKGEEYMAADEYQIDVGGEHPLKFDYRPSWSEIIHELSVAGALLDGDLVDFKHSVLLRKLSAYDSTGTRVCQDTIFEHLNGEISYNGRSYFHIDKGWYQIEPTFISDLDAQCSEMLKDAWNTTLLPHKFDLKKDEDVYNQSYLNKPHTIVLDTVTPENIECCDILIYSPSEITLVHVKKGFKNTLRDLAAQISIAAKRIQETTRSTFSYLELVEKTAKKPGKKAGIRQMIAAQTFPPKGIVDLFKESPRPKLTFCLAFVDIGSKKRLLKTDITQFESNIAKYSLIELSEQLKPMGYGFKVVQIEKL